MDWKLKFFNITNLWWLALLFILFFFQSSHPLNSDEGVILDGAWNLINGRHLYIDFFEFIPPASFYLIYLGWFIFGVSYFVAKFIALLLIFFGSIFIFRISNTISASKINYLPPLLFIVSSFAWPVINHNVFSAFFIITASYFFIKGISLKAGYINFVISGFLAGVSAIFLQQKGLALLLIFLSYLIILSVIKKNFNWLKPIMTLLIFFFLPILPLLLIWPLQLLYNDLISFPADNYLAVNRVSLALFFLYFILTLINIVLLKTKLTKQIWFLLYLQFGLLLTSLTRPDYFHLSLSVFPLYVLLPLLIEQAYYKKSYVMTSYFLITIYSLIVVIPVSVSLYYYPPLSTIKNLPTIEYVKHNCQSSPYLYAGPFNPGLYFETGKLNPTAYSILITGQQTPDQFDLAEKQLKKNPPDCAVLNYYTVSKFNYNKNNPVDNFISANYQLVEQYGNNLIYKFKVD